MDIERFTMIVESYGSDFLRWPENERADALNLLRASSQAQVLLEQAKELDICLERFDLSESSFSQRKTQREIIFRIKLGWLKGLINLISLDVNNLFRTFGRSICAGVFPLVFGMFIGFFVVNEGDDVLSVDEELSILGLVDISYEEWIDE